MTQDSLVCKSPYVGGSMKNVSLKARKGVEEDDSKYCIFATCKEVIHVRGPSYVQGILEGDHFFILTNPTFIHGR
jgi:hypothetical protein